MHIIWWCLSFAISLIFNTHSQAMSSSSTSNTYYNVKNFGAKGDGSTDDTVAIQATLNAAATNSNLGYVAQVYFPAGTYMVSNLSIPQYTSLCGDGYQNSIIQALNAGDPSYLVASQGWLTPGTTLIDMPTQFYNVLFDGNNIKTNTMILRSKRAVLSYCYMRGANGGANLMLSSSGQDGTTSTEGMRQGLIDHCLFGASQYSVYDIFGVDSTHIITDWIVTNNLLQGGTTTRGATLNSFQMPTVAGWLIHSNHFYGVSNDSILLNQSAGASSLSNNLFEENVEFIASSPTGAMQNGVITFGPGNLLYSNLVVDFGPQLATVISSGNVYTAGYILHNQTDPTKTIISVNDRFNTNTSPFQWSAPNSPGLIQAINSYNNATGIVYNQVSTANNVNSPNIAMGYNALNNATGSANTALGHQSGQNTTTGIANTFVGYQSGLQNTVGTSNTFIGNAAGASTNKGGQNTFVGKSAGSTNTVGNTNTCIGYNANVSTSNLVNATALGANTSVIASNTMQLGNANIQNLYCQVPLTIVSDRNQKKDIHDCALGLAFINALKPVEYRMKDDARISYGLLAQDLEKVLKTFGSENLACFEKEMGNGNCGIRYNDFIAILIKALQELSHDHVQLKELCTILKDDNNALHALVYESLHRKRQS